MNQVNELNPEIIEIMSLLAMEYPDVSLDMLFQELYNEIEKSTIDGILELKLPKIKLKSRRMAEHLRITRMPKEAQKRKRGEWAYENKVRIFRLIQNYYKKSEDTFIDFKIGRIFERDGHEITSKLSKEIEYETKNITQKREVALSGQVKEPIYSEISLNTNSVEINKFGLYDEFILLIVSQSFIPVEMSKSVIQSSLSQSELAIPDEGVGKDKYGTGKDWIEEEDLITKISEISTELMHLTNNDEKIRLIGQLNRLLLENKELIKKKYPDILVSILDSL